jgi:transketolase
LAPRGGACDAVWRPRWVDLAIGIDSFGALGPGAEVLVHFGISPDAVADRVAAALGELV